MGDSPRTPEGGQAEKDGEEVRAARADGGRDGNSGNYGSGGVRATQADRGSGGDYGRGEKGKTLSEFWDFDKVYLDFYSTGGGIRTPINGFGDRYSTLELHPYFKKVLSF